MSSPSSSIGVSLDAVSLLGFGPPSPEALPEAGPGETILRYGGWSLKELRDAMASQGLMQNQNWYDRYAWASERLPSGLYVLRLPVPNSNRKTFEEQSALLLPGEEPAPVILAASTLLAIQVSGGGDPLQDNYARCKERTSDGFCVRLVWYRLLRVRSDWFDYQVDNVWLSAARKIG